MSENSDCGDPEKSISASGGCTRPGSLPVNGSTSSLRSQTSLRSEASTRSQASQISRSSSECCSDSIGGAETDSDFVDIGMTEKPSISKLMQEYAEQDKDYDGVVIVTPCGAAGGEVGVVSDEGPPRPFLIIREESMPSSLCDDDDNICKDGLHLSKLKDKDKGKSKSYAALRLDKGQQHLSLYRDGELVDQMVTTPLGAAPPDNSRSCMLLYHESTPGTYILCLSPNQSPQLKPYYGPNKEKFSEVISYIQFKMVTSPDTIAVKVESKTHVYLVLDYTDPEKPKLLTVEEDMMESILLEMKSKQSTKKIKPIINVRNYPHTPKVNNTAFYFKTETDYYFICVEQDNVHLGVKRVPASSHNESTYINHLIFGPKYLDQCSHDEFAVEGVDSGPQTLKTAIASSPVEQEPSRKVSISSPESVPSDGSSPCCGVFGSEGVVGVDSGLDVGSKWSEDSDDNMQVTSSKPQAVAQDKTILKT